MKIPKNYNPKVSVLIINYNNEKFIKKSIDSIFEQKYKNCEIIFFDDNSTDASLKTITKFKKKKNFFLISNRLQTNFGSFNQINGYSRALKKSKGEIVFFLDSDDFFHKNKIKKIVEIYKKDPEKKIIMDIPIYKYHDRIIKQKKRIRLFNNYWPQYSPQSCISIKREFANEIFENIKFEKFPNIWLDFRIAVYAYYFGKIHTPNEHLTYYRQSSYQESSNFHFLGVNWWRRRLEAHQYIKFFFKLKKIHYKVNFDYLITKSINIFYKLLLK